MPTGYPRNRPPGRIPRPATDRFWEKVDKSGDCWLWTANLSSIGYGLFRESRNKFVSAHSFAYQEACGPVPAGMVLDHICHGWNEECIGGVGCVHRRCCNPTHLEPVTRQENTLRSRSARAAINARKSHCPQGHPYDMIQHHDGARGCRACRRASDQRRRMRQKLRRGEV